MLPGSVYYVIYSQWQLIHVLIPFFPTKSTVTVNKSTQVEKLMEQVQIKPNVEICLNDLKLVLGPELKIVYPLILNFGVSGELELNGLAHTKWIKPRGILTFENGEVDLVATQVCVTFYFLQLLQILHFNVVSLRLVFFWLSLVFINILFMFILYFSNAGEVKTRAFKHCKI